ncbi:MAG: GAF domain-containing protein, partial [Candidatus Omnitrophica bacterium]|nr:GAF domain-containing protein [Candidatus Omnitrophota bacterium]
MNSYAVFPAVSSVICLVLGLMVWSRKNRTILNLTLGISCFLVFCSQACWFFLFHVKSHAEITLILKIGYSAVIFIPVTMYHFFVKYVGSRQDKLYFMSAYGLAFVFLVVLWLTPFFVSGYHPFDWGFYPEAGPLHPVYLLAALFLVFRAFSLLLSDYKKSRYQNRRNQTRYIILALLLYFLSAVDFLACYGFEPYPVGVIPMLASLMILTYVISRHRGLDIEAIFKQVLVFGGLLAMVLMVAAAVQGYGERFLAIPSKMAGMMTMVIAILLYDPTRKFFVNLADKYLFPKKEGIKIILNRLSKNIITILDIGQVGRTILSVLERSLRLKSASIFIQDEGGSRYQLLDAFGVKHKDFQLGKEDALIRYFSETNKILHLENLDEMSKPSALPVRMLEDLSAVLVIPLFVQQDLIGILTLGKKKSEEEYTQEELDFLSHAAGQMAIALSNARLYDILKKSQIDFAQQAKMAAIGTLSAGISHEIKNPLNHIKVGIGMLKMNR